MGSKLETEQMKVLSFLTSGQAAPERNGGDVERSDQCVRWRPSKATTWRGRHHLNLPHHQVEQYGGTPALWSAAGVLYVVNSAAPPKWVRGQSGGPCKENFC